MMVFLISYLSIFVVSVVVDVVSLLFGASKINEDSNSVTNSEDQNIILAIQSQLF